MAALEAVDRFLLRPRPPQRIRDTYLDTGAGDLATARVAFRVRDLDGRPLLTLKSAAVRTGLAAERLELEGPWSATSRFPRPRREQGRGSRWPTWPGSACSPPRSARPPAPRGTRWSAATPTPGRWPS